jgi:diacylglycerol kinase
MRFLGNLADSFRCAGRGLWLAGRGRNLRIMFGVFLAVVVLATAFDVSGTSWAVLLVCASVVLTAEVLNTSIEELCDYVSASMTKTSAPSRISPPRGGARRRARGAVV